MAAGRIPLTLQASYSELIARLQEAELEGLAEATATPRLAQIPIAPVPAGHQPMD